MLVLSLPTGEGFGWATCGNQLVKAFKEVTPDVMSVTDGPWGKYDYPAEFTAPILQAVLNYSLLPMLPHLRSKEGNYGYTFIEQNLLVKRYVLNYKWFWDGMIAGSLWGAEVLKGAGIPAKAVIQGVDSEFFCPGDPQPPDDSFVIFSGGKAEFRKGQDIVLKAVGILQQKHSDVRLITNWYNPWPATVASLRNSPYCPWNGEDNLAIWMDKWIPRWGIASDYQGNVPVSPEGCRSLYRRSHIGLFPNRAEAGTNLVMMEFMACGKPVIATYAHGHKDVLASDDLLMIRHTNPTVYRGARGPEAVWFEPDLDEVVSRLELAYQRRDLLPASGRENRERMQKFTWESAARQFLDICVQA